MERKKAFPVDEQRLSYWHDHFGYRFYGEPTCKKYGATDTRNGHRLDIQEFKKNGNISYIGYDTDDGRLIANPALISSDTQYENNYPTNVKRNIIKTSDGIFHAVFPKNRNIVYAYSNDNGATWNEEQITDEVENQTLPTV